MKENTEQKKGSVIARHQVPKNKTNRDKQITLIF